MQPYDAGMRGTIRLLGGSLEVALDGEPVPGDRWTRRDAVRLVTLLALAPGRSMHREQVVDTLWPDQDPAGLWPRLHKAAHFARKA